MSAISCVFRHCEPRSCRAKQSQLEIATLPRSCGVARNDKGQAELELQRPPACKGMGI